MKRSAWLCLRVSPEGTVMARLFFRVAFALPAVSPRVGAAGPAWTGPIARLKFQGKAFFQCHYVEAGKGIADDFGMAKVSPRFKHPPWRKLFVKQWREFRNLTQEQLAERAGMSVGNISQLERGLQGYSMQGLEALSQALNCEPGHLFMVDPTRDEAIWSIWERAGEAERKQIVELAKVVLRTGT